MDEYSVTEISVIKNVDLVVPRSLYSVKIGLSGRIMNERKYTIEYNKIPIVWAKNQKFKSHDLSINPILVPFIDYITACSPAGVERQRNTGQSEAGMLY